MRNLNESNITEAVLESFSATSDDRLREILGGLIRHLHDFAREVNLTEEEWMKGIQFLTATGHMCDNVRQEFILLSDTLGLSQLVVAQNNSRPHSATEQTVFGPFHVEGAPLLPSGTDIANGRPGSPCFVQGRVSAQGQPVAEARVDVWQSDGDGFYDVQDSDWKIEETSLRATFITDANGCFSFRSLLPASYPIPTDGPVGAMLSATGRHAMRPAHIHFMVERPGFDRLITHVFVEGDEYLESDTVFGVRSTCVGNYVRRENERAPDGSLVEGPFYTLDYEFVLDPVRTEVSHG
ncbi:intradiol ring-cleavage dioxygenase [Variovorax sp. EL159]|uniref:intradiol ring-cleavage dioxygenase n=1 Tax=Variovorax sp. EL159 TaxID=1566270 RepID=UPI00087E5A12|nr:intradiol ring-cleavage dioxygenase [Variovorax sp. EL159]SCX72527.1 hydroxyquinol 1,2-dioxygenase [Variovorax sp. EL159]